MQIEIGVQIVWSISILASTAFVLQRFNVFNKILQNFFLKVNYLEQLVPVHVATAHLSAQASTSLHAQHKKMN